ncbi:TauD/TfdA family dioxygenase [Micromonospora sp. DT201]|uniref:TauD/TfdA family dioxygenase n=1 Tax=Micromonospora sp. DT201 TaxID=3393442 RepID=UPI003CE88DBC
MLLSVDVETPVHAEFALSAAEHDELEAAALHLTTLPVARVDDPAWLDEARRASVRLPERVRNALRQFQRDPGPDALLRLRHLPIGEGHLPATPTMPGSVQRVATIAAATEVLIGLQLGELVSFREEKTGALVQDVVPVPGMEKYQGNAGSVALNMHVENAFHPRRPDYVGLLCLRNDHDNVAGLQVASIRRALPLLSDEVRAVLHQPRFITEPPASFGMLDMVPDPQAILRGSSDDPDIIVDFESTRPLDGEATAALAALGDALSDVRRTIILEPGDLAFVDNRLGLHGRTAFTPRYDGRDRWLQRVFVHLDIRRSRDRRHDDGNVLTFVG